MAAISSLCRKGAHALPEGKPPMRLTHCWGTARERVDDATIGHFRYVEHPCECDCHE